MKKLMELLCGITQKAQYFSWVAPLMARLYLVPVFWVAGINKYNNFESTVSWFGAHLGMPLPSLMAFLATSAELVGAVFLAIGLCTRLICIPLIFTMIVAAVTVHWKNGWQAILDTSSAFAPEHAGEGIERLSRAKDILREHGNYSWLTEHGNFVIINNGIEFAATYIVLLALLLTFGPGKWVSIDHWIREACLKRFV